MTVLTDRKQITLQSGILQVFCFFLIFSFKLPNNIYLSNIIYFLLLISQISRLNLRNAQANRFYILFIVIVALSTIISIFEEGSITGRNIIQLLFTFQYFILILDFGIGSEKIMKKIYFFGLVEALYLLVSFLFLKGIPVSFISLFTVDKKWGYGIIPNFPNGLVPSLLIVLYFSRKYKRRLIETIIIVGALLVTTSRAALLGILLVLGYWELKNTKNNILHFFYQYYSSLYYH